MNELQGYTHERTKPFFGDLTGLADKISSLLDAPRIFLGWTFNPVADCIKSITVRANEYMVEMEWKVSFSLIIALLRKGLWWLKTAVNRISVISLQFIEKRRKNRILTFKDTKNANKHNSKAHCIILITLYSSQSHHLTHKS